ncbi:two-component system regulatory protein YycI [Paenibacillus puerhi]|uniref:two-component system regulatory protein YycI n=1 Tax=Paenibacillus puerhi TaxID=2692622 RepID=UPI001359B2CD|nr:two-component system regulatory protein YycI [Paenibacillus puerhi]
MDWGRAKTILILSFLLLNVILAVQLGSSRSDLLNDFGTSPEAQAKEELQRLMKLNNIQLPSDIPKETPKLREIVVIFDERSNPDKAMTLATPFKFDPLIIKGTFKDMLAKTGIPNTESYQFDPIGSRSGSYVFHQLYGSLPMFEVQLELLEKDGIVTSYKQGYVEVQSEGVQKEQSVISPYIVLASLIENYLPPGSVITGVRLGYHGQVYNSQTMYMVPSWRVSVSGGDPYFIHAINGAVEAPQNKRP